MGCTSSKVDDLPAVALCRERCSFLDQAIHHRFALAEAHISYLHSLKSIGVSLHRFFDQDLDSTSPVFHTQYQENPPTRKSDPQPSAAAVSDKPSSAALHHRHSHSDSGSHLHFHSDSDSEEDDDGSLHHHSGSPSPLHHPQHLDHVPYSYPPQEEILGYGFGGGGGSYMHMNYMKKQSTPSVLYEQRPMNPEIVNMGESSSASYYPYSSYPNYQNPSSSLSYGGGGVGGGYNYPQFSSQPVMPYGGPSLEASTSKPPPSPPRASGWEFLNPFESFEKYYPPYPSSRDSREFREEEGVPDLEEEEEDEDYTHEVVKEVHGNQKYVDVKNDAGGSYSKEDLVGVGPNDEHGKGIDVDALHTSKPSPSVDSDPMEYVVHMVDKKVVNDEKRAGDHVNVSHGHGAFKGDADVIKEIQVQFEHAAESGNDLAVILEVGKLPYNRKHSAYQVSSKMLHAITPSLPSTSRSVEAEKADPATLDVDQELGLRSKTLSSTLHKLYLWEKKLHEEVKAEERMRVLHERKSKKLKHLDKRGADFNKVDATRTLVRSLSTKIRIAIQVVDKISVKINKLRDEDLFPLLNETIQGLSRMWKSTLESHHNQCRAIIEAKRLDAIALRNHYSDAHLEATLQLEHELLNWILRFSCWVSAHKGFIRALDNWLMKCLLYVPEETADGIVPFSPGRMGAPPVFGVCHQWSQSLDRVSEKEVLDYMRDFATNVLQLWDRDKLEMRQRMTNEKDMERRVKNLDKEDQKIQKEIQALDKRMILVSGDDFGFAVTRQVVYQSDATKGGSLQVGLQRIFEAMEKFAGNSLKVYEELLQRIEDETRAENIVS